MQSSAQPGVTLEFLKEVYRNQWEQRWRGSRNQDWGAVAIVAAIAGTVTALQNVALPQEVEWLKALSPLLVVLASAVALRILQLHQGVMNHANHIAKGIERVFGIQEASSHKPPAPDHPLFVGFTKEGFVYPSKAVFSQEKPVSFWWFLKMKNVQAAMGWLHLVFLVVFLVLFAFRLAELA